MIERELCSYLICDECDDDDPEVGPYGQDESEAKQLAWGEGWRVDGDEDAERRSGYSRLAGRPDNDTDTDTEESR